MGRESAELTESKSLEGKSLTNWLEENEAFRPFKAKILDHMKRLTYTDEALSNLSQALSVHGRLFLNSLLRACTLARVPDPTKKLDALAGILEKIENSSHSAAHFIWVGPPTRNASELLGVRSLNESKGGQKFVFGCWMNMWRRIKKS